MCTHQRMLLEYTNLLCFSTYAGTPANLTPLYTDGAEGAHTLATHSYAMRIQSCPTSTHSCATLLHPAYTVTRAHTLAPHSCAMRIQSCHTSTHFCTTLLRHEYTVVSHARAHTFAPHFCAISIQWWPIGAYRFALYSNVCWYPSESVHDSFHSNCYTPEIHHIHKLKFLGTNSS